MISRRLFAILCLLPLSAFGQITPYGYQLIQKPNAVSARAWLGVTNSQNGIKAGNGITFTTLPSGLIEISTAGLPGSGTVTSVALSAPAIFSVSGSPITTSGTLSLSLANQTANTVFSGPSSGVPAAPTFRSLVADDIPSITESKLSFSDTTTANSTSSKHGLLPKLSGSSSQFLNGSGGWTTPSSSSLTVKEEDGTPSVSSVTEIKVSNGTLTDNGGGSVSVTTGGGSSGGIDITLTSVNPTDSGTNFDIDFSLPAQVLNATGSIAFNYAQNVGSGSTTSRVANVFVQATNYARRLFLLNESTNWNISKTIRTLPANFGAQFRFQSYGGTATNVAMNYLLDELPITNMTPTLDPTSISGLKLWVDASRGVWQDFNRAVPAQDGLEVRGVTDWSGTGNHLTNNAAATMTDIYHTSRTGPFGVPCLAINTGAGAALNSPAFTALTQPNWVFIVYWSVRGGNPVFDSQATGARISCDPANYGGNTLQLFCGTSLTTQSPTNAYWTLFSFKCNGASSLIRTNGAQAVSGNAGAGAPAGFRLGTDAAGAAVTTASYVAEVLVYNANLSNADRDSVEEYLRAKYSLY